MNSLTTKISRSLARRMSCLGEKDMSITNSVPFLGALNIA